VLSGGLRRHNKRVAAVLVAIAIVALSAVALSSYAHATHHRVSVRITLGDVIVRAYLNCRLLGEYAQPGPSIKTVDLGWLRPQDIVSVEVTSLRTSGHVLIERRVDGGDWETLKQSGSLGYATDFPPLQLVITKTFLAAGTSLGAEDPLDTPAQQLASLHRDGLPSCRLDPIWDFGPAPADPATTRGRPNRVYDIADTISTRLPWALAIVGIIAFVGVAVVTAKKSSWTLAVASVAGGLLLWLSGSDSALALALVAVAGLVAIALAVVWLFR
jgi:hypothetical protein